MVCQEYVVAAMQCRRNDRPMKNCSLCPYALRVSRGYGCDVPRLCGDALELLREKTDTIMSLSGTIKKLTDAVAETAPRVMTLDEARTAEGYIWAESCNINVLHVSLQHNGFLIQAFEDPFPMRLMNWDGYGKEWRYWTSCPTDEQREATPWIS